MKYIKQFRIVILILFLVLTWALFGLHKKTANPKIIQNVGAVQSAITKPIKDAVSLPQVAQAANIPVGESIHVPVLMYHHVGPLEGTDAVALDLTVSAADFESQVQYFKNLGYESVTLRQIYDALENNDSLPKKPIVFTFDDGYKDVFVYAIPVLKKYGYTGTFAIATELLGRPTYAVWDDVIAAQKSGMEIVSHTENHLDLTNKVYSDFDLHREIFDAKDKLEQKLGVPINFFIYPYGKFDDKVVELVKQAGYKMAFTTAYGQYLSKDNLLTLPRVRVHGQDGLEKLKKIFEPKPRNDSVQTNP